MRPSLTENENRPTTPREDLFLGQRIHLIGVGGCGMSGLARILVRTGASVSGSDMSAFAGVGELTSMGVRVMIGHDADHLDPRTTLVVISAAIPESNPELRAARERGVRVTKYAEFVGQIMRLREGVAIAGTHGKSTTTAMCAHVFRVAGLDPWFLVGAESEQLGGNSGVGDGMHFIVESCEFDRSFLHMFPRYAAILNIEPDHFDCYRDLPEIVDAFASFGRNVLSGGLLVCQAENPWTADVTRDVSAEVETFGLARAADWRAHIQSEDRGRCAFDVLYQGEMLLTTRLALPGRHNVENALAATALAYHAGADTGAIADALATFAGITRRMMLRSQAAGITIVDDYAHHPTEIRVTLEAIRKRYSPKRTWVVFQPHQYERTRHLMEDFARSFDEADAVIVPDIYGARETDNAQQQKGAQELADRICRRGRKAQYVSQLSDVTDHLMRHVAAGDLVVTMGAGDVWKVADALVERIC